MDSTQMAPHPTNLQPEITSLVETIASTSAIDAVPTSLPTLDRSTSPSTTVPFYRDDRVAIPAAVGIALYSLGSLIMLIWLCVGGRLDSHLNLLPSTHRRLRQQRLQQRLDRNRDRDLSGPDQLESEHAASHTQQQHHHHPSSITATAQPQTRPTSIATVMGNGDEADLTALRRDLQAAGIDISERTLREQRRRHYEFLDGAGSEAEAEANYIITWPGSQQSNYVDSDAVYEAEELERVRLRRSANEARYLARLARERRRERADARIVENMRALGML